MIKKIDLANSILDSLNELEKINKVILRGSLVHGGRDRYTDIDISVYSNLYDLNLLSNIIKEKLEKDYKILIDDWGMLFMPQDFVHTIYFDVDNLFSFLDIEYHFDDHSKVDYNEISNDPISHELKLLVLNIKRVSRNENDNIPLNRMHKRFELNESSNQNHEKLTDLMIYFNDLELNFNQRIILEKCQNEVSRLKEIQCS